MPSERRGLRGRRRECEALDRLLRDIRAGHSRVLVLRGEAGGGKTALLDYLVARAAGRVVRAAGVEPESEIAYAVLQQLCAPLLGHLDRLPEPQRDALATAFGLSAGDPPDGLLIGLAVLGLFAEAAADEPLVLVVDDVQWLDWMSEVILTFVARRLDAESVGLVFAARSPGDEQILSGLPELRVDGLSDTDARALLDSVLPGPIDSQVRDRIVAETRGNPLALLELPRMSAELAFGFGAPSTTPLVSRIEEDFRRRIAELPEQTRLLLLTAAVEPVGDVPLLWRALERLGVGPAAAAPAEAAGLVEFRARVRFRHPLVRSASWRLAEATELREVHRALAEAADAEQDSDRRDWHRAHATVGPDEEVAGQLERLRAQLAFAVNPGREAGPLLLGAAKRLETLDLPAARETYLSALAAAVHCGRLGGDDLRRAAEAARRIPAGEEVTGLLLTGLTTWALDGYAPAVPLLSRALDAITSNEDLRLLWLASPVAHEAWDDASWHRLTEQAVGFARATGALSLLPTALVFRAGALLYAGRFTDAADLLDEADSFRRATGLAAYPSAALALAAHRGQEEPAMKLIEATAKDAEARGEGRLLGLTGYAMAVLSNGLGHYPAAMDAAQQAAEYPDMAVFSWTLSELIEAATRAGQTAVAAEARERLAERTRAAKTDWARGAQALADALAGPAEQNYCAAIDLIAADRLGLPRARARLLYGEWLRRQNRRNDARNQLRTALEAFTTMGAEGFAARAGRELTATGETVRKRATGARDELTAQEAHIARLAVAGRTNPEIGALLFLSPRTVEWHLRKVYTKLDISSRRELAAALRDR